MDPKRDEQPPELAAQSMFQQATMGVGIPQDTAGLLWPRKPMSGRAIGSKKGMKGPAKSQSKGKVSSRAMRSSKSHPPKKYQKSPIGWE